MTTTQPQCQSPGGPPRSPSHVHSPTMLVVVLLFPACSWLTNSLSKTVGSRIHLVMLLGLSTLDCILDWCSSRDNEAEPQSMANIHGAGCFTQLYCIPQVTDCFRHCTPSWRTYHWMYLGAVETASSHWLATSMLSTLEDSAAQASDRRDLTSCLILQDFVS